MVSITLSVPDDVKQKMDQFSEINWSGFVRKSIIQKTNAMAWKEEMKKKLNQDSEFEDWAVAMGREVNENIARKIKKSR